MSTPKTGAANPRALLDDMAATHKAAAEALASVSDEVLISTAAAIGEDARLRTFAADLAALATAITDQGQSSVQAQAQIAQAAALMSGAIQALAQAKAVYAQARTAAAQAA